MGRRVPAVLAVRKYGRITSTPFRALLVPTGEDVAMLSESIRNARSRLRSDKATS